MSSAPWCVLLPARVRTAVTFLVTFSVRTKAKEASLNPACRHDRSSGW